MDRSISRRPLHRLRGLAAAAVLGAALTLSGCGLNVQTLQAYTPAHGVNIDQGTIKVRNLLIVAGQDGSGVLSASIVSSEPDSLVSVSGVAHRPDGTDASALTASLAAPVELKPGAMTVLTTPAPAITVSSPDLKPGLTAQMTLTFASGQQATSLVPVLSSEDPIYASVVPGTTAAPSAPATPAAPEVPAPTETPAP